MLMHKKNGLTNYPTASFHQLDLMPMHMSRQRDKEKKRQKDKKTKIQKYKKTKRQKNKDQKESLILRRQGSFALLRCFISISCCQKTSRIRNMQHKFLHKSSSPQPFKIMSQNASNFGPKIRKSIK